MTRATDSSNASSSNSTGKYRVTVVCTGNICRSPMAERVLEDAVERAGLSDQIVVDSAGTRRYHVGDNAHDNTVRLLQERGLRHTGHSARELTRELFDDADLILLMDRGHRADIEYVGFTDGPPVLMWREFDPSAKARGDLDVPDPWGHPMSAYAEVHAMLEAGLPALIEHLREQVKDR